MQAQLGHSGVSAITRRPVVTTLAILLACGVASSVLYVVTDVVSALRYEGYEFHGQMVSELGAARAPTRVLFVALMLGYNALLVAFTVGIWRAEGDRRVVRRMCYAFAGNVVVGLFGLLLFNMDQRGADSTFRGSMHGPATLVESVFIIASMGFAAAALGPRFRLYTIVTIVALILFGSLAGLSAGDIDAGKSTPWAGIIERVNIYAYLVWVAVLAVALWLRQANSCTPNGHAERHAGIRLRS